MQCIEKKKKDSVCYVPEERIEKGGKRIKENDAICRETDGESAPAVDEKKKKGGEGRAVPPLLGETECENVHGGGRDKRKLLGPVMSLCTGL